MVAHALSPLTHEGRGLKLRAPPERVDPPLKLSPLTHEGRGLKLVLDQDTDLVIVNFRPSPTRGAD